ncbi:hypothetical protein BSL78_07412 [Apostichopus japonicus]|uniref:Uncharacterized protein n=1 Tax=Stichopus japonicus TaxID=307972 RepID=A0A2G8L658_STIJA|nr:hypothetical protein BSL78_07412 [Apostichopus japonicus]
MNYIDDTSSRWIYKYKGKFSYRDSHKVDRYSFEVIRIYLQGDKTPNDDLEGVAAALSFTIDDMGAEDCGSYHVTLIEETTEEAIVQHNYRLFTIYQPSTPLLCEKQDLSTGSSIYRFSIICSVSDAYPSVVLDMIEPNDCSYYKSYSQNDDMKTLTVYISACVVNSTVGCTATQGELDFMSTIPYSNSCSFDIPKDDHVYQPPTPLVCEGPSSSPSASYHVVLSCSITEGYSPINLEVIKPEGCEYQKHYTDNNGTKELLVYVTSCDQNSTIGCIATQEPLESQTTSQFDEICEFNISRTDQDIVGCSFHCTDGPDTNKSTDCYVIAGCDFSFPDVPIYGNYKSSLSLSMNFIDDTSSRWIYKYKGKFSYRDSHKVDRYSFEVIRIYLQGDKTPNDDLEGVAAALSFTIDDMGAEDCGSYHVTLIEETTEEAIVQHNYRLFTIYQPSTPLLCEKQDLSTGSSIYRFSIICSVSDAYPSVVLDMIEPNDCSYYKSYSQNDDMKTLTVYISACAVNSTVGCTATQGELDFMSTIPYSNSCSFDIPKDDHGKSNDIISRPQD